MQTPPPIELDEAEVFIEYNSTDGDFGIQFFWDGEAWASMAVTNDSGTVLDVEVSGNVLQQGLTEGFFESAEPTLDELSFQDFLTRFPEDVYEFEGWTINTSELVGEAELTHIIPCPPSIDTVDWQPDDGILSVSWHPVTGIVDPEQDIPDPEESGPTCIDPEGELEIKGYEAVFEAVIKRQGNVEQVLVDSVTLPADVTSATAAPEFVDAVDTAGKKVQEVKFEVIAIEDSGNKTITERDVED